MSKMTTASGVEIRGLYGMVDVPEHGATVTAAVALATQLIEGGARILQARGKHAHGGALFAIASAVLATCRAHDCRFIVNDRLDVALAVGADGVHLGQDDVPLAAARKLAPPGFLIGISTHNLAQARSAADGGADYIGFGPVFATSTKINPDPVVGLEQLALVSQLQLPVVAIGGITLDQITAVAKTGAAAAAVISAVNGARDVVAAASAVTAAF